MSETNPGTELIGIYGGTFDPPHAGHTAAAEAFAAAVNPDKLYIIPASIPPHKKPAAACDKHRLNMCKIAFAGVPRAVVSAVEIERGGHSYTVDTLGYFASPGRRTALLCGCDMLLTLDTWRRAADIFRMAEIYYLRRDNGGACDLQKNINISKKITEYSELFGAKIRLIDVPPIETSSTELRERIIRGEDCRELLHPGVADYIKSNGIYTNYG